jgi:trehalose-6-phosphate synthase
MMESVKRHSARSWSQSFLKALSAAAAGRPARRMVASR